MPVSVDTKPGSWLPHVHLDGNAYHRAMEKVVQSSPVVLCPSCAHPVHGLAGAEQKYTTKVGKHVEAVKYVGGRIEMVYSLTPCGCKADQDWASAFMAEMSRRQDGKPPREVVVGPAKPQESLEKMVKRLEMAMHDRDLALSSLDRGHCYATAERLLQTEFKLVVFTDQLLRAYPHAHQFVPCVRLSAEVRAWGLQHNYHMPHDPSPVFTPMMAHQSSPNMHHPLNHGLVQWWTKDSGKDDYAADYPMPKNMLPMAKSLDFTAELAAKGDALALAYQAAFNLTPPAKIADDLMEIISSLGIPSDVYHGGTPVVDGPVLEPPPPNAKRRVLRKVTLE